MLFKKIFIILVILLVAAGAFQLIRSYTITRLIKNINQLEELPDPLSADIPHDASIEKFLIIYDKEEENSQKTLGNTEMVLDYMKKEYESKDISDIDTNIDLEIYDGVLFIFESLDLIGDDLSIYIDYVSNGGSLLFLLRPVIDNNFREVSDILGISKYDNINDGAKGIKVSEPLMLGIDNTEYNIDSIKNSSIDLELKNDKNTLQYLTTSDNTPLLWKRDYGSGRFIIFNGTILNEKNSRGLLGAVLSLSKEDFIYPIANIKMLHIDDFPAPIPQGTDASIMDEFNRTIPQFYRDIWWSDMIKLSKKYDLKYSAFVIQTYDDSNIPPFQKPTKAGEENLLIYGKEIFNLGGELGIHGYNHQSLVPEGYIKQDLGYNPWENQDHMKSSVEAIISFINGIFPQYKLKAYVPPSNILSEMGRTAILAANDELEVIAGVYLENMEKDIYDQEFDIAPDGIIEFPRVSSGYQYDTGNMWSIYNSLNLYGIFSHFIHPDDILDPYRSGGKSWSILYKEFETIFKEINPDFSWLNSYTISEGSRELQKYLECKPKIEYFNKNINIFCIDFRPDVYFILRTQKNISSSENIEFELIKEGTYLITLKKPEGFISLESE